MTGGSITNNTTGGSGGGIYSERGDVTLTNVTVSSNTAKVGGGVWNKEVEAVLDITNSIFSQNTSDNEDGGAIYNEKSQVTIETSTFSNNTGTRDGGALYSKRRGKYRDDNRYDVFFEPDDERGRRRDLCRKRHVEPQSRDAGRQRRGARRRRAVDQECDDDVDERDHQRQLGARATKGAAYALKMASFSSTT